MNLLLAFVLYALTATKILPAGRPAWLGNYVLGASDVRSERRFSLTDRYPDPWVNNVFKYNILHTLDLMSPSYSFTLQPGEVFAFHEDVLPQFAGKVNVTMRSHFNYQDGFKSDGWLTGDGVCHLASLMYWAARDAGLEALAPTNHNFANIPEVPKEYGVSIFYNPATPSASAQQNLYITNTLNKPVEFAFNYDGAGLTVKVSSL